jgi:hypothetical protein
MASFGALPYTLIIILALDAHCGPAKEEKHNGDFILSRTKNLVTFSRGSINPCHFSLNKINDESAMNLHAEAKQHWITLIFFTLFPE